MTRRLVLSFAFLSCVIILITALIPQDRVRAATVTVTNTNDSGAGSLREALSSASAGDTIAFAIPGAGVQTIIPQSPLPALPNSVIIDGYTQSGSSAATGSTAATLLIEIDGENAGNSVNGLELSGNNTVRGLVINRFDGSGIRINSSNGNVVEGNIIGLNAAGTAARGNGAVQGGFGIFINAGSNNTIGGTTAAARNIISGNGNSSGWSGGILLTTGSSGNLMQGNYIGTDISGTAALGNVSQGINIDHSSGNTIGGLTAGARNLISGNAGMGINIFDTSATSNTIQGNYIGTNVTGTAALGNTDTGVNIWDANNNTIGGITAGAGNLISGNGGKGIYIGGGLSGTQIQGNLIGTDKTGTTAIGNTLVGVQIDGGSNNTIGGTSVAARNIISGNAPNPVDALGGGIQLSGSGTTNNTVQGNYIGTDVSGNLALGNGAQGIFIDNAPNNLIGGTANGAGNVISANDGGIMIFDNGIGTKIQGNLIGTDVTGTVALGNNVMGLWIAAHDVLIGGTAPGARNIISGNGTNPSHFGFGVYLNSDAKNNTVQGNYIGTNITGTVAMGNAIAGVAMMRSSNNLIGGNTPAARNIISGNDVGVAIAGNGLPSDPITPSNSNIVRGNYIGTDVTGTAAIPNHSGGVDVSNWANNGVNNNIIGGSGPGEGNLISGNEVAGIMIDTSAVGTQVLGNTIGLDANGASLANPNGIYIINASNNTIGGTLVNAGNVISGNGKGVVVIQAAATGNQILGNSIFSNTNLGIDLGEDGLTANDPGDSDSGPSSLQNFPVLSSAEVTGSTIKVSGTLNSEAGKPYRLEFFANPVCDSTGYGEGETYLGFASVATNGSGNATFSATLTTAVPIGYFVTSTATNTLRGTSEFSACVLAGSALAAAPVENYSRSANVTVSWTGVTWAAGYIVQWDDNASFSSPTSLPPLPDTAQSAVISVPGNGVYYWRVRAQNDADTITTWSAAQSFTVSIP
jgi:hypothetical protein